jgi:hypothetical protein
MFDQLKEYQRQRDAEDRQVNLAREQKSIDQAEGVNDLIALQEQKERTDLLRWQQDLGDELEELKHRLRRETYVEDKGWIKQKFLIGYKEDGNEVFQDMPPIMNEIGINNIEIICLPLTSRNMINSNFSEDRVLDMIKRTCNTIVTDFAAKGDRTYGMEFNDYSVALRMIKNVIIPAPFRAVNGWNKKVDSTISKDVRTYNESPGQQIPRRRIFGIF